MADDCVEELSFEILRRPHLLLDERWSLSWPVKLDENPHWVRFLGQELVFSDAVAAHGSFLSRPINPTDGAFFGGTEVGHDYF